MPSWNDTTRSHAITVHDLSDQGSDDSGLVILNTLPPDPQGQVSGRQNSYAFQPSDVGSIPFSQQVRSSQRLRSASYVFDMYTDRVPSSFEIDIPTFSEVDRAASLEFEEYDAGRQQMHVDVASLSTLSGGPEDVEMDHESDSDDAKQQEDVNGSDANPRRQAQRLEQAWNHNRQDNDQGIQFSAMAQRLQGLGARDAGASALHINSADDDDSDQGIQFSAMAQRLQDLRARDAGANAQSINSPNDANNANSGPGPAPSASNGPQMNDAEPAPPLDSMTIPLHRLYSKHTRVFPMDGPEKSIRVQARRIRMYQIALEKQCRNRNAQPISGMLDAARWGPMCINWWNENGRFGQKFDMIAAFLKKEAHPAGPLDQVPAPTDWHWNWYIFCSKKITSLKVPSDTCSGLIRSHVVRPNSWQNPGLSKMVCSKSFVA